MLFCFYFTKWTYMDVVYDFYLFRFSHLDSSEVARLQLGRETHVTTRLQKGHVPSGGGAESHPPSFFL